MSAPPSPVVDPPAVAERWCSVLQLSSLTFLVPSFLAVVAGHELAGVVLGLNAAVSWAVHEPGRPPAYTSLDLLDNVVVTLWVATNVQLWLANVDPVHRAAALVCAVCCGVLRFTRQQWPKHSAARVGQHVAMHLLGTAGTSLLLV